jgi:hypothetical protein
MKSQGRLVFVLRAPVSNTVFDQHLKQNLSNICAKSLATHRGFEALRAGKCATGRRCTVNAFSMLFRPHAPEGESGFEALRAR